MRHDIDRYKRMKYLKAVARVQYEFRDFLANTDQKFLPQGLRTKDMQDFMVKAISNTPPVTYRGQNEDDITMHVHNLLDKSIHDGCRVRVGGKPKAEKEFRYVMVTVGYMWLHKVYKPFYKDAKLDNSLRKTLILSAERVRLNHKSIILWEVLAYRRKGGMVSGYVAQAKTEARHTAFNEKAHLAARAVEAMMSDDINKVFGINEREN